MGNAPGTATGFEASVEDAGAWGGAIARSLLPLTFESTAGGGFRGTVRANAEGGVRLATVEATGHIGRRDAEDLLDGRGEYVLCQLVGGGASFQQAGRTARLNPGEFVVYDSALPMEIVAPEGFTTRFVTFPRDMAGVPPTGMEELLARPIGDEAPLSRAVGAAIDALAPVASGLNRQSRLRALGGLVDMTAALFLDELGLRAVPEDAGQVTFQRLAGYVEEHLADPALGPRAVAAAHFVSVRLVHKLFSAEGTTVGAWIRARRLERCREDLGRPDLAALPVASLVSRWGVMSVQHFTNVFRATYGQTPAAYRRQVLGTDAEAPS